MTVGSLLKVKARRNYDLLIKSFKVLSPELCKLYEKKLEEILKLKKKNLLKKRQREEKESADQSAKV